MKWMISGPPTHIFIWFLWDKMGVLMVVLWKSHRALIRRTGVEVKDAMIIARGLMCEVTMTNNTGLNSIISWVVDLNDRKSPFYSEYSCRSEHWWLIFVYTEVVISTSQLLHINYFMTFPFVTSYFGSVTLEIIIKSRGLTIGEVVTLWIFI